MIGRTRSRGAGRGYGSHISQPGQRSAPERKVGEEVRGLFQAPLKTGPKEEMNDQCAN